MDKFNETIEISFKISNKVIGISGTIDNHSNVNRTINSLKNNKYSLMLFNENLKCLCMLDLVDLRKLYEYPAIPEE